MSIILPRTANFIFPIELLVAAVIYSLPLPKRNRPILRTAAALLCFLFSIGAYNAAATALSPGGLWIMTPAYGFYFLFIFLEVIALTVFCCKVSLPIAVNCVAYAYATQHFAYCLCLLLFRIDDPATLSNYPVGYLIVFAAVYAAFYGLFARKMLPEHHSGLQDLLSIQYAVATLLVTLILSIASAIFRPQSPSLHRITLYYALFCCVALLYGQLYQNRAIRLQNELELQTRLWQERKAQYDLSRENIALINQKCHDLKHQIRALRSMSEGEERDGKLHDLEESVMIYDSIVETGNDTIDTVLTEKSLICEQNHIVLTCIADGKCLNFMDVIDLYTIFGNMLDNAIECVRNLENPDQRVISISIFSKADLVFIQCENYYRGDLTFENGLPRTTKAQDGWHGYGVGGIRQTAEKYGGFLTIETENSIFLLRITIPVQDR